jgi:plastocyanin
MRRAVLALPAVLLALLVAPAQADQEVVAAASKIYVNPDVAIAPGEALTFRNTDVLRHDVTAVDKGPDGKPLFASATIDGGTSAAVAGADALPPGSYAFYCSIHPGLMRGTLTVTAPEPPEDSTPPDADVLLRDARLQTIAGRGRAIASVTLDEPASVRVTAIARGVRLARTTVSLRRGTTPVPLTVGKAGRRALTGPAAVVVHVVLRAEDAAGNVAITKLDQTFRR